MLTDAIRRNAGMRYLQRSLSGVQQNWRPRPVTVPVLEKSTRCGSSPLESLLRIAASKRGGWLSAFRLRLRGTFLHAKPNDLRDQLQRKRLIKRKLNRSFRGLVLLQLIAKCVDTTSRGIKAYVVGKRGKMNQVAVEVKGWHLIADLFGRPWCGQTDRGPDLQQHALHIPGKALDVLIDGCDLIG